MSDLLTIQRPPLRYHGGKFREAKWVASFFPEHEAYVEVFGGAAGVLLRKERSKVEIYNDREGQVVNLFEVLRDAQMCGELCRLVALTPFSRREFLRSYDLAEDRLEMARRFVVRCAMGHGTSSMDPRDSNGFRSCDIRANKAYAKEWEGQPEALRRAGRRFQGVTIENLDYRRLIPKFAGERTLFYCDPPYPMATRNGGGKGYVHEMSDDDHRQLAWMLNSCACRAVVSGYPCGLYDEIYKGWIRHEKGVQANGQRGSVQRTEILLIKP